MSIDLQNSYDTLKTKIGGAKTYTEAKVAQVNQLKNQGDNLESALDKGKATLEEFKQNAQRIKQDTKSQLSQLFDITSLTNGSGSNTSKYFKDKFISAISKSKPEIMKIIIQETIHAINCSSQQEFVPNNPIYVNINSIDFFKQLQINPSGNKGKFYYEKKPFSVNDTRKSLNRELYKRTQNPDQSFSDDPNNQGLLYQGGSGQNLFNITFVNQDNNGNQGSFFKIELNQRLSSDGINNVPNKVVDFVTDYFNSIEVVEPHLYSAKIMDILTGALSVEAGTKSLEANTKIQKFMNRILGLCFDSTQEIDTQGSSKIPELDGIDENFFELTSLNLRDIEEQQNKYNKKVVELVDCDNFQLPVNTDLIFEGLDQIISGTTISEENDAINGLVDKVLSNAQKEFNLNLNLPSFKLNLNNEFIKNLPNGLVMSILSPKVLLPIMIMIKSLSQSVGENIDYTIDNVQDFFNKFKRYVISITSKIVAIFVKVLFDLIKKDIFNLLQVIVKDLAKEKATKKYAMIAKLVQLLIIVANFIKDYRQCKSVIDELLNLFRVLTSGWGGEIPLPLLFASQALDGYSYTRAFLATVEEMQKLGLPTGNLPSGAPNKFVLGKLAQMKAMAMEEAENGKVQIAVPALAVAAFGGGTTIPQSAFGKKF
jgi:hypothetical protein